ncbi:MAG: hypothetical protein AAF065_00925 [Verrucomicrobiota bacterium]
MHTRLVRYLQDNRDHIIENWLIEAEIPPAQSDSSTREEGGVMPYSFFIGAFEHVVQCIESGNTVKELPEFTHLNDVLGLTCDCKQRRFGGRVCMELHDSGLVAFMSVFADNWDTGHEFNQLDRECCEDLINHALSGFFDKEIDLCMSRIFRKDCPFSANE